MKFVILLTLATMSAVGILACTMPEPSAAPSDPAVPPPAQAAGPLPHPELPPEALYKPCAACHKIATPEIYQDWYASTHGLGNVKCFQCHGTYEDFRKTPELSKCAVCHLEHLSTRTNQEKTCWECHTPHLFRGHAKEAK